MSDNETLDVIVRFHDIDRLDSLDRCVFSLLAQDYRPLQLHLVVQRFTDAMIETTRERLQPLLEIDRAVGFNILNWSHPEPRDARSALANLGFAAAQGRYLGLLDYDDTLYPEAYRLLVSRLRESSAAIAFGGICRKVMTDCAGISYVMTKQFPYRGAGLRDLFTGNFCPIHSFLLDRARIPSQFIFFDPLITRAEDYDLLLRICSQFPSDFSLVETIIGDYYIRTDGSNTVNTEWAAKPDASTDWLLAEAFLAQRRRITPVSAEVQRMLGLAPRPGLTIRDLLDAQENR
jgi:hypothetical protein